MGQYIRHAVLTIDEVLPFIAEKRHDEKGKAIVPSGHTVGVNSVRLKLFAQSSQHKQGIHCKACGLKATHFAVEGFTGSAYPSEHLNLYGMKGDVEVLFTKDHKLARANGGGNGIDNMQTMCQPCNTLKGTRNSKEFLQWRKGRKQQNAHDKVQVSDTVS